MAPPDTRIAFLGLGIMGSRMAANLSRAGFPVTVWNRTRTTADELAAGFDMAVADTPAAAASGADMVITIVVDAPQVEAVLFGTDDWTGAADGMGSGGLVVDMSTIAPTASLAIAGRLAEQGIGYLDAPVTGSRPKAEDGTLTIMAGGSDADFERARPAFEAMGELIVHAGAQGHGSWIKLLNNTLAAVNAAAVAEALTAAGAAGIDPAKLIEVVQAGSGASFQLDAKSGPMLDGDYDPLFKLQHMLKDVRHTLDETRAAGSPFTLGEAAEPLYSEAGRAGFDDADFAAVIEAVKAARRAV